MLPALRIVADRQFGVFTGRDARRAGYRPDEVQSAVHIGAWCRLRRGVYLERAHLEPRGSRARHVLDCVAVLVSLADGPAVSHSSAARVHGLHLPAGLADEVRLTDEVQWRTGRGYQVARAGLPPEHVGSIGRFPMTTPARTLVDCAREWSVEDAVIAMDAALQLQRVGRGELHAAVLAATHWVGIGSAARAFGLTDGRAESPLETRGRLAILGSGLPCPELQVELVDARGVVARLDGWYEDAGVALEFDGRVKYDDPRGGRTAAQVFWEEKRREDRVRDLDVRVVRIVQADMGGGWPRVAGRLAQLLATPMTGPRRFTVVRRPEPGAVAA